MKSSRCTLEWPSVEDYDLIEQWLRPTSTTSGLTGDTGEVVSANAVREYNESGRIRFLMVRDTTGRPVGVVNYRRTNLASGAFSVGGAIGDQELWGSGIGFEAMRLLVDHVFHNENAHRVEFATASYNRHSLGVLTRAGFVLEGVLRDHHYLDGEYHDRTIWSVLRSEFEEAAVLYRDRYPVADSVPAADKLAARKCLASYVSRGDDRSLAAIGIREKADRPY